MYATFKSWGCYSTSISVHHAKLLYKPLNPYTPDTHTVLQSTHIWYYVAGMYILFGEIAGIIRKRGARQSNLLTIPYKSTYETWKVTALRIL